MKNEKNSQNINYFFFFSYKNFLYYSNYSKCCKFTLTLFILYFIIYYFFTYLKMERVDSNYYL